MSRRKDSKLSISAEDGDSVGIDVDQAAKMEELDFPKPCVRLRFHSQTTNVVASWSPVVFGHHTLSCSCVCAGSMARLGYYSSSNIPLCTGTHKKTTYVSVLLQFSRGNNAVYINFIVMVVGIVVVFTSDCDTGAAAFGRFVP